MPTTSDRAKPFHLKVCRTQMFSVIISFFFLSLSIEQLFQESSDATSRLSESNMERWVSLPCDLCACMEE